MSERDIRRMTKEQLDELNRVARAARQGSKSVKKSEPEPANPNQLELFVALPSDSATNLS